MGLDVVDIEAVASSERDLLFAYIVLISLVSLADPAYLEAAAKSTTMHIYQMS